jgi:hypothetical protein
LLFLVALTIAGLNPETASAANDATNRPFLAIWRDHAGLHKNSGPYLRIAIWDDGKIVFARDPAKWDHDLLEGRLNAAQVKELKQAITATGVFELKGNCYLVPDAPVDCVMLDCDGKQQMLYWDEVESPGYGINIQPTETHLKFKSTWKEVNRLALQAVPKDSQPYPNRFERPPESWRLKRPIQSAHLRFKIYDLRTALRIGAVHIPGLVNRTS